MRKNILGMLFALLPIGVANAAYLSNDYPVCISEDSFNRLSAAAKHKDLDAIEKMLASECTYVKDGTEIEKVVSQGWTSGIAHVKVYVSGNFIDLWTNSENLKSGTKE